MNQFELFLNRMRGGDMPSVDMPMPQQPQQPDFRLPGYGGGTFSQMPLMNRSIPGMNMGNELGVAQGQGNFNIMNPFTYGNMNRAVEGTRAGDENISVFLYAVIAIAYITSRKLLKFILYLICLQNNFFSCISINT